MTILPSPTFPLAVQSRFGQNTCDAFICSVLCLFISTAYKRMLSFSIHPDFCPPVNGVLPTEQRAQAAISLLLKEQRPINFKTVAETAGISTARRSWHNIIKKRIKDSPAPQTPKPQVKIPPKRQASSPPKEAQNNALRARRQELGK